jgi:tetratricopeptide (TPR) repeat protein
MGFFKSLFKEIVKAADEAKFTPDFSKTEYDNWLEFLSKGGTSEEWNNLITVNNWHFKEDKYEKYQKEVKSVSDNYYYLLQLIQREWSVLYNTKKFSGKQAEEFEKMCLKDISYYIEMRKIDLKYDENTPLNVPAFTRLAMLYEKQGEYEKAAFICKEACVLGIDERSRLVRMLKKADRTPTAEEAALIKKMLPVL